MTRLILAFLLLATPLWAQDPTPQARLMMVEQDGCYWCERWDEELGAIYPKTAEGRAAPLLRHDIGTALPDGITLTSRAHFTPTFVLIKDGTEVARIEGYPGEDFFWPMLNQMISQADILLDAPS